MRLLTLSMALAGAGLLAACGGSPSDSTTAPVTPPVTTTPTVLSLSGVVAKGAALAGASVTANCAAGTATPVTSSSTGSYTLTITDGALPCVLEATGAGADAGLVLHSVATGSGDTATSNITPVTELLVAQITGQNPADFMDAANASTLASTVTTASIAAAKTEVIATLAAAGLDTTALASADMVSGTLAAGTGAGYDGVLDALGAALTASGTTLTEMTTTVATTAAGTTPGTESSTASLLPAGLLLRPKASNCDALRSTDYRLIKVASTNGDENAPSTAYEDFSLNAETLTATFGPDDAMTLTPNGDCRYTLPDGEAVVSKAGVIVMRHMVGSDDDTVGSGDRANYRLMIALPKQDLAVADLAGSWSFLGTDRGPLAGFGGFLAVAAGGTVSNFSCLEDALTVAEASCTPIASSYTEVMSKNTNGSFRWASAPNDPDPFADTAYAYRAGNGDVMVLLMTGSGEPVFGVKRRTITLPTVGQSYANWTTLVGGNMVALAFTEASHVVTGVDTAAGTTTRDTTENGTTVSQTLAYNSSREGYVSRVAVGSVRPFTGLQMSSFGLTAIYLPNTLASPSNNSRFGISVRQ